MKYCIFICLFIFNGYSQDLSYEKGIIIDSIPVNGSTEESFGLYLPSELKSDTASPIVFIFDPLARGRAGLIPFIEASEKYQLILVCSNNCRNMAFETNYGIADRWFKDVFSRFSIDPARLYLAGFSGGARLASTIAVLSGQFKAVVACGAAFSGNSQHLPVSGEQFYYAGLVGNRDMNYQELIKTGKWLDQFGLPNRIFIFEDDHRWPESQYISKAFDWFYLQDIKNKVVSDDDDFLKTYLSEQLGEAQILLDQGQILDAADHYEQLIKVLADHFTLDSIYNKAEELKKTKDYKKSLKLRDQIVSHETSWTTKLVSQVTEEMNTGGNQDGFKWWHKELAKLDENYVKSSNKDYQNMGKRLQQMLFAFIVENFDVSVADGNIKDATYLEQFSIEIWGNNPFVRFRLAEGFAILGEQEKAISHLGAAVDNGWENKEWILKTKAFKTLGNRPEFQLILKQLQ